jgi:hypothetical protein
MIVGTDFAGISGALWAFAAVLGQVVVLLGLILGRRQVKGVQETVNGNAADAQQAIADLHDRTERLTTQLAEAGEVPGNGH